MNTLEILGIVLINMLIIQLKNGKNVDILKKYNYYLSMMDELYITCKLITL
jgi:hypothetical protein